MNRSAYIRQNPADDASAAIGAAVRQAVQRGLGVGRTVKIGTVRGIVIGYNIARDGNFPGTRFPLLIRTELGVAKFGLNEVVPA
ncbi:MAG TPA: hypothetical protein VMC81_11220 [Rhodocyclaceae bacterium]|nr:hypothetical protein [Rhodocyclaceae bacterium]